MVADLTNSLKKICKRRLSLYQNRNEEAIVQFQLLQKKNTVDKNEIEGLVETG
jgi:hypothetical protein